MRACVALVLAVLAAIASAQGGVLVRRVAMTFAADSVEVPPEGIPAIGSMLDDARRDCLDPALAGVVVEEVRALPLGRVAAGPTPRTHSVAAAVRNASNATITPYEASLAPESERARRIGVKPGQVLIELTCNARG